MHFTSVDVLYKERIKPLWENITLLGFRKYYYCPSKNALYSMESDTKPAQPGVRRMLSFSLQGSIQIDNERSASAALKALQYLRRSNAHTLIKL